MNTDDHPIIGLNSNEVKAARLKYGSNKLVYAPKRVVWAYITGLLKDPMILLLLLAVVIYAVNGKAGDSIFLGLAVLIVAAISWFQERRSNNALNALKELSKPRSKVIREGNIVDLDSDELVVGDKLIVEEGFLITADGEIVKSNDFCVNESVLTGESLPVYKDKDQADHYIYRGTTVVGGLAIATVTKIGNRTRIGEIGNSLEKITVEKSPLEIRLGNFVKKMAVAGAVVFAVVWAFNYYRDARLLDSLLKSLTLAMSILPEEIPVAYTTFMALAAWRLIRQGVVVKEMKTVETLGCATVICIDKTGTITENKMALAGIFSLKTARIHTLSGPLNPDELDLIRIAMWASEPIPYDPMEVALHEAYTSTTKQDERANYKMLHEYPLSGKPPMMTHIFESSSGARIIAAKGAPEALIANADLSPADYLKVIEAMETLAASGYRLLGVAEAIGNGNQFPEAQQELPFVFKGLVAFYDPPKANIGEVLQQFYGAGISVKIITGDNATTTKAIAREIGLKGFEQSITGDELMLLNDRELEQRVKGTQVFSRMYPDAKLRVINALKRNGEVVAMTGDGINDGPALKAAHIGVAMGKKGTEIARQAASLVLVDDDLSRMVDAIGMGRKMYGNLKKAIRYIISIHIPIIAIVFVPLALGWKYPNILSPIHVIFLELIMGPTCSVIYENEPMEPNAMLQAPRPMNTGLFNNRELMISIIQGLAIASAVLLLYQWGVRVGYSQSAITTIVFMALITANIALTLANRSFNYSMVTTLGYRNKLLPVIILITAVLTGAILYIPQLQLFFGLHRLSLADTITIVGCSIVAVWWIEILKWLQRRKLTSVKS